VACTYRQQYFDSALEKPVAFFDLKDNSSGTLTARISNDPTQLQQLLGLNMAMVYVAIFQVIGCIAIAFAFGWKLTLVTMASMPIIMLAGFNRVRYEITFEKLNNDVFSDSSQFASEAIGAFRTVTSLTLEDMIINRYAALLKGHVDEAFRKARYATLTFSLSDSITMLCIALTFWYGGTLLGSHEYNATQFFIIYIAVIQGSEAAGQWSSFGPNFAQASAAANRILKFRSQVSPSLPSSTAAEPQGGVKIVFDRVHFTYPTREIPIFRDLSFTIERGQFAAIVGPSGCGKTTVISLLERFYEIDSGQITCDDMSIASIPMKEYRQSISLVAQEPNLFQGSIRENVMLGVDSQSVSEEAMYQACRDAEIHDFILSLPEGK
jgi:ATP-binding cassette subfamily B (MDR/TAP) protein 1